MITAENLPELLSLLGFAKSGDQYIKEFSRDIRVVVDMKSRTIAYPAELVAHEAQTLNFSANENFVVLECVTRLLEKGYAPRHIELEPKWRVGHGASGGRADVLVSDNLEQPLMLVECKTPGAEFTAEWKATQINGGQLFSYAQQISGTQFLCLYASDLVDGEVAREYVLISHRDNESYLIEKPALLSYRDARDVNARHRVWTETYKGDFTTKGVFEDAAQAYEIGRDKYTLQDLQPINSKTGRKKYHEFATILRQHNVSGRENAFDILVNLFLAKLVDESTNSDDLGFYWKGVAYDTHFELLDRLQRLYQKGMKQFLSEDITYINNDMVVNALRFIDREPDATERAVLELFHRQRFYTNSDFSFIDVHNESLFYENASVLVKVLQMWQDIRLTATMADSQFLGDMFEGFLDQGVKQSEGQFFTPLPICRFLVASLPVAAMLTDRDGAPLSVLDYACGAGHFLNVYAQQLPTALGSANLPLSAEVLKTHHAAIVGIEKEYRLSKVSKVSAFMYGTPEINVRYADALSSKADDLLGVSDVVISNPPYSVRGFLETLDEADRSKFALTALVDKVETSGNIESFFVERAQQLMAPGGVAGIFLPSSILSNSSSRLQIRTREILLESFDIVAIVEFGSQTFAKTGTNTITAFLRRKRKSPETSAHYRSRVESWFGGSGPSAYDDTSLVDAYTDLVGVGGDEFQAILNGSVTDQLKATSLWRAYERDALASASAKARERTAQFRALGQTAQDAERASLVMKLARTTEAEKLFYFCLAQDQPNDVVIVRAPEGNKAQKDFLGYEWSSAKGDEGIHMFEVDGAHSTPLYDPHDESNPEHINSIIRDNFNGVFDGIPEGLSEFVTVSPLTELMRFEGSEFNKGISLTAASEAPKIESIWPSFPLAELMDISGGSTPDTGEATNWDGGTVPWATLVDTKRKWTKKTSRMLTKSGVGASPMLPQDTILWSSRATIGQVSIAAQPMLTNQGYKNFVVKDPTTLRFEYVYYVLEAFRRELEQLVPSGSKYKEINTKAIGRFEVPRPPTNVQDDLIKQCSAIDNENSRTQERLIVLEEELDLLTKTLAESGPAVPLGSVVEVRIGGTPSRRVRSYFQGSLPWVAISDMRSSEIISTRESITDVAVENSNVKLVPAGTTLLSFKLSIGRVSRAGVDLYTNEAIAALVPTSSEITNEFLFSYFYSAGIDTSAQGHKAFGKSLNSSFLRNDLLVPLPEESIQTEFVEASGRIRKEMFRLRSLLEQASVRKRSLIERLLSEEVAADIPKTGRSKTKVA